MAQFAVSVTILVDAETQEDALWEANNFLDWATINSHVDFLRSDINDVVGTPSESEIPT